uniref:CapA family protein n=1 Tax=Anaerococcus mediterraneensis TaxID=1870984 RepID=UPI0009306764|nr:CapA family protein [Anaerococcus mediterraneensis]
MNKKKWLLILSLAFIFLASSCSNDKDSEVKKSVNVADLVENLDAYQKQEESRNLEASKDTEESESDKKENISSDDPSEDDESSKKEDKVNPDEKENSKEKEELDEKEKTEKGIKKVKLKAFGDIMAHSVQIQTAQNRAGGSGYDFSDQFVYINDFIKDSDLAIGNYETTTNPNRPYAGFPRFNTPASYLTAIKDAGFDIVSTANNHSLDTDVEGILTTIDAVKEAGLDYVGSMKDGSDKMLKKEINGVKFTFLAYTYGANGLENLVIPREEVENLNYLTNEDKIKEDIKIAKSQGADFVVVYPHWGIEYQSYPDQSQINLGRKMIDWGADLVIGNHPHVVQPIERYKAEDGREGLIAYALGNFVSFQSLENNNDIRVEQAIGLEIDLEVGDDGHKSIADYKVHPLWVGSSSSKYGTAIRTYLAEDFLDGGKYYDEVNENQRARIKQAYDMVLETANTEVK